MKTSVCVTVFNELDNIEDLFRSLMHQTIKPDEIVVVDGGSTDGTLELLQKLAKKYKVLRIQMIKSSRSKGRNIAVNKAKHEVVAMTDAGCVARDDWLEKISKPFLTKSTQVVAGFYDMTASGAFQKAESVFLGVAPKDFDSHFLPSTRSVAFRKSVWERVGGFPESLDDTAEDTMFNYKLLKAGVKIKRVKSARVEWAMPASLRDFSKKIYFYAKGDAKSGIYNYPTKLLASHNIKMILKIARYFIFLSLLVLGLLVNPLFLYMFFGLFLVYLIYSFFKVYLATMNTRSGLWGVVLQIASDVLGVLGFVTGVL